MKVVSPEFEADYRVNAEGLRDETPHPQPKPAGVTRILLLGDSFAFGIGGNYDSIWPVILERELRARGFNTEVVKAGTPTYDTRTEHIVLQRLQPHYQPDWVLIGFLPNDIFTNLPSSWRPRSEAEAREATNPTARFDPHLVGAIRGVLSRNDGLYASLYLMTARRQYFETPLGPRAQRQFEITRQLLAEIQDYCRARAIGLSVFSIPQVFQVLAKANGKPIPGIDVDHIDREFGRFAAERGFDWLPILDHLARQYRQDRQDLYYRVDGHFTRRGNAVAGMWLTEQLARRLGARR